VDISRYKNVPVPTSYMAEKSDYDFVGAYHHDERGGLCMSPTTMSRQAKNSGAGAMVISVRRGIGI
jgi:hypothetical protein